MLSADAVYLSRQAGVATEVGGGIWIYTLMSSSFRGCDQKRRGLPKILPKAVAVKEDEEDKEEANKEARPLQASALAEAENEE